MESNVSVLLASLDVVARPTLTSAHLSLATTTEFAKICLKDTNASANQAIPVSTVKKKNLIAATTPAHLERCAKTSLELETSLVSAVADTLARTAMSPSIHAQPAEILAPMAHRVLLCFREDSSATACQDGREQLALSTLMIVLKILACSAPTAQI
jgi:hypothetical protein